MHISNKKLLTVVIEASSLRKDPMCMLLPPYKSASEGMIFIASIYPSLTTQSVLVFKTSDRLEYISRNSDIHIVCCFFVLSTHLTFVVLAELVSSESSFIAGGRMC